MADRSIVVRLKAEVAGFKANMAAAKKSVDDLTKADVKKPGEAFESMANKAAIGAAALAVGVGKAIKSFADFDAQMSGVSAALPDAAGQMDDLRQAALDLGKDTQFSATEAAQGITEMAKAGVSASDILNGGIKGGLDLAAAGQLDVARASEIAATALNQFNLEGRDVAHVADLYAAAAGKAQGSVEDIAQAMKFAGVTASSMGISIEETTGTIGLFASKGIIGEQAGTSFRSMLLSMTAPSKAAAEAMDEYGISMFDAQGNFIGISGAAQELQTKLGPLDQATRTAALGQIFGNESIGAAIALYEGGGKAVKEWTDKVNDAGFAQEQAAKLTDNLKGDIERLGGSLETVFIEAGSGANDALRGLVQGLGGLVDIIGKVPGPVLLAGTALGALALGVPKGILMWRNYASQLDSLGISFDRISKKAPRTAKAIQGIGKAAAGLAIAATAVGAMQDELEKIGGEQLIADLNGTGSTVDAINASLARANNGDAGMFAAGITDLGDAIHFAFSPGLGSEIDNTIGGIFSVFGGENVSDVAQAAERFRELDTVMAQLVSGGKGGQAEAMMRGITEEALRQGVPVERLQAMFPQYAEAIARAGNEAKGAADDTGLLTTETDALEQAASDAEQALSDLQDAILGLGSPVARQRSATRDYEDAIDGAADSLKQQRDELIQQRIELGYGEEAAAKWADQQLKNKDRLDLNTEAGRRNQAALDAIHDATLEKVAADFAAVESTEGVDAAQKVATETMKKGRQSFIDAATAAGMTKDEANALADQLGLIPENVNIAVKQTGAKDAEDAIDRAARNRTATITVQTKDGGSYRYTQGSGPNQPQFGGGHREFASGGYTGSGGKYDPAGIVHKGEVVWSQDDVRRWGGPSKVDAMRQSKAGYADGGIVGRAVPAAQIAGPSLSAAQLVGAMRGAGLTVNISGGDPHAAAREVIAAWQWESLNG